MEDRSVEMNPKLPRVITETRFSEQAPETPRYHSRAFAMRSPNNRESSASARDLRGLMERVVACERCPRLTAHCRRVAEVKRRAYRDWEYWGRPVPSFGRASARLLMVGLAPGAHGANRTGRMFTGDSSGDFLYKALYEAGFASQPESTSREDGLELLDAYITAAVRCAPPDNKPSRKEFENCASHLDEELIHLPHVLVVVTFGRLGHDAFLAAEIRAGRATRKSEYPFSHGAEHVLPDGRTLISSYHPSRQNTQTGRLTPQMFRRIFERAREILT